MNDVRDDITINDNELSDIILGRPVGFFVGEDRFCLYPVTFGKMLILKYYYGSLGLKSLAKSAYPKSDLLSMVHEKKVLCAETLVIHTLENDGKSLFDVPLIRQRADFFSHELSDEDLASLLLQTLDGGRLDRMIKYLEIDKEQEKLREVLGAKGNNQNSLSFGGKTVLGNFIIPLKEMGFSLHEILFEYSYDLLRLLLMDKQVSIYLSDDELRDVRGSVGALIDGESSGADEKLRAYLASKGITVED